MGVERPLIGARAGGGVGEGQERPPAMIECQGVEGSTAGLVHKPDDSFINFYTTPQVHIIYAATWYVCHCLCNCARQSQRALCFASGPFPPPPPCSVAALFFPNPERNSSTTTQPPPPTRTINEVLPRGSSVCADGGAVPQALCKSPRSGRCTGGTAGQARAAHLRSRCEIKSKANDDQRF